MAAALGAGDAGISLASIEAWSDLAPHAHEVQLYEADATLIAGVGRFLGAALGSGAPAVVLATKAHRDALTTRLAACGLDVALAAGHARYVSLDAGEVLAQIMVDGQPDAGRFGEIVGGLLDRTQAAAERDHPPMAVYGELVALLCAEGRPDAAIRLEQLWNDLARTRAFDLRCGYPLAVFGRAADGAPLQRICAAHSRVLPAESYSAAASEDER